MTSPRQRPARHSPPLTSREAALVGALTAFAKSPSVSTSPGNRRPQATTSHHVPRVKASTQSLKPPAQELSSQSKGTGSSGSPGRPIRHDSAAALHGEVKELEKQKESDRPKIVEATKLKPKVQKKPKPLRLSTTETLRPIVQRTSTPRSIDTVVKSDGTEEPRLPSTSSLVQLFEQQGTAKAGVGPNTPLKSPKPVRKSLVLDQDDQTLSSQIQSLKDSPASDTAHRDPPPLSGRSGKSEFSSADSFRSARDSFSPLHGRKPSLTNKPALPPPRRATKPLAPPAQELSPEPKSALVPHSAPIPIKTNQQNSPYSIPAASSSSASIQATYNALHPRRMSALRTGDSLANALVASSLASSRAPSPAKFIPPPVSSSLKNRHSHHSLFSRTPSPHKRKPASATGVLRQTLRKDKESSADEDVLEDDPYYKHKKKRHIRKHANKYHEGDRKRWRNVVTERERNRYEGVWAANKGILAPFVDPSLETSKHDGQKAGVAGSWKDDEHELLYGEFDAPAARRSPLQPGRELSEYVHAFVVKDIWSRSRLPDHILEEIWNLVDGRQDGWLSREEFVVGMWLVDQRLRGRKLPVKVSDSVWDSVRFLKGIKIKTANLKGRGR